MVRWLANRNSLAGSVSSFVTRCDERMADHSSNKNANEDEVWTVGRLLTWTTEWLKTRGSDSPRLDAEVLLAFVRNCPRILLYTAFDEIVDGEQRQSFRELVRRRGQGEPVAYLVGIKEFFSMSLDVTPATLIPRPETEGLVVRALDVWKEDFSGKAGMRVLDVGTGSGALAIALASHMTDAIVTATDISQAALEIASGNVSKHSLDERIDLFCSDVLDHPDLSGSWDIIVSNPPYIREDEFDGLPDDVRLYEPRHALVGGVTGCEIVQRLVQQASGSLTSGGWMFIEVGPSTVSAAEKIISDTTELVGAPTVKDSAGLPRIVQARAV